LSEEPVILPPTYYLDNFNYLIDFVEDKSGKLLSAEDKDFIQSFKGLSKDAKCTYIRLINRKGPYFRTEKLEYEEINDIPAALYELDSREFIKNVLEADPLILHFFRKDELLSFFPEVSYAKAFKKDDLILEIEHEVVDWLSVINTHSNIIIPEKKEEVEYLKLLFFGHHKGMMSDFVVRDIGNVTLEKLDEAKFTPWFDSLDEAKSVYQAFKLKDIARFCLKTLSAEEINELFSQVEWEKLTQFLKARKVCDKYLLEIGKKMEQAQFPDYALNYYKYTDAYPSRERQIRILDKKGEYEACHQILDTVLDKPMNAKEAIFAKDFQKKAKQKIKKSTTIAISNAIEIELPIPEENITVEKQVLNHFNKQGYEGIHSENHLWRSSFGLLFWDLLYNQELLKFHNPLQRQASNLYDIEKPDLFIEFFDKTFVDKKIEKYIKSIFDKKYGVNNPLIYWYPDLFNTVQLLFKFVPRKALRSIFGTMALNLKEYGTGFPDLFIWNKTDYFFYEIKSPNDHLAPHQLFWIEKFKENDVKVDILRIAYHSAKS